MTDETRACLRCGADLTDRMGVAVFIAVSPVKFKPVPGLLCIECGGNGKNGMSREAYDRLTGGQR